MKSLNLILSVLLLLCLTTNLSAQRSCGHTELMNQLMQDPDYRKSHEKKLKKLQLQAEQAQTRALCANPVVLPVAIHYQGVTNPDIACLRALAADQINILNNDYQGLNSDINNWINNASGSFPGISYGETCLEFCIASQNHPSGYGLANGDPAVTVNQTTGDFQADWSGYINIVVRNIGALGYSPLGGNGNGDAVVVDNNAFGSGSGCGYVSPSAPYNLGRTLTHELGHYLLLDHIWGPGSANSPNCNDSDNVGDTPNQSQSYGGCPSIGVSSCGSNDLHMNYMDYTNDACMYMFSAGQSTRMENYVASNLQNVVSNASSVCGSGGGGGPTCSDGIQNGQETGVDCGGPTCPPCQVPCTDTEVTLTLTFDNYPEETSWDLRNSSGVVLYSGGTYPSQPDGSTITETFCLVDGCYDFNIYDSYGDGICCQYGNGSYSVTDPGGTVLASGGQFGSSETTNFCLGGNTPTCTDGIQNGQETGVDCGGPDCPACPTCTDGIQNGQETGVDCGGPDCPACPTCMDGIQNGQETGVDCGGPDCPACPTCTDGIQNGQETGVDCGGPDCPACPSGCQDTEATLTIVLDNYPGETTWTLTTDAGTQVASGGPYSGAGSTVTEVFCLADDCYTFTINDSYGDGICCAYGNGSYALVDEGGTTLAAGGQFGSSESTNFCIGNNPPPGGCTNQLVNFEDFEGGFGIWNDGGSDCRRSINDQSYANSGSYCVRLRDNTSTSTMTTDVLDLNNFDEVTVDFSYIARSMENNEDFWLRVSTNGGSTFTTVAVWARGTDFENDVRESASVTIPGPFTANTVLQFRCDASGNSDWVYIDDVNIEGCANASREIQSQEPATEEEEKAFKETMSMQVYPNPTNRLLNVVYDLNRATEIEMTITDYTGKVIDSQQLSAIKGKNNTQIDVERYAPGFYFIYIRTSARTIQSKKFIVVD